MWLCANTTTILPFSGKLNKAVFRVAVYLTGHLSLKMGHELKVCPLVQVPLHYTAAYVPEVMRKYPTHSQPICLLQHLTVLK